MPNHQTKAAILLTALVSLASFALVSCGTKGPLYIPEQRYPQAPEQPASSNSSHLDAPTAPAQPIIKE